MHRVDIGTGHVQQQFESFVLPGLYVFHVCAIVSGDVSNKMWSYYKVSRLDMTRVSVCATVAGNVSNNMCMLDMTRGSLDVGYRPFIVIGCADQFVCFSVIFEQTCCRIPIYFSTRLKGNISHLGIDCSNTSGSNRCVEYG